MSSTKTWLTNAKRTPFVTRSITEPKDTSVRNVTSGTQNTDVMGDVSNKTPSAKDTADVTHGFESNSSPTTSGSIKITKTKNLGCPSVMALFHKTYNIPITS